MVVRKRKVRNVVKKRKSVRKKVAKSKRGTVRKVRVKKAVGTTTAKRKPVRKAQKRPMFKEEHCVVKHGTKVCERYDERKVYGSVYAACFVAHMNDDLCEKYANSVAQHITKIIKRKKEMHAKEISEHVHKKLKKHSKEAAYLFKHHQDVS